MKNLIICLILSAALFSQKAQAQKAGLLDSTFNDNGINLTPNVNGDAQNFAMAIQSSDGKTVTAGYEEDENGVEEIAVMRYKLNGTLDNSFNTTGIFTKKVGTFDSEASAIAIQADGKIVVGGFTEDADTVDDFFLARLNSNGTIDNTFGTNGIVTTDFGGDNDGIQGIAIQADGKIVATGWASNGTDYKFGLVRYNTNGTLDMGFGNNGKTLQSLGTHEDSPYALVIQQDGKVVVGGYSKNTYNSNFGLVRFTTAGVLDSTFGTNGIVKTDASGFASSQVFTMALQPNGKILAGGYANNDSDDDFAVARYNSNGTLDTTFGYFGLARTDFSSSDDYIYSVMVQPDAKIAVAGFTYSNGAYTFALARYKNNGSLDSSFGSNGLVTTNINDNDDDIYGAALQSDGKIVVAGTSQDNDYEYAVARYLTGLNTGILDFSTPINSYLIYPNPVKENARLEYELVDAETISVQVFDVTGKLISTVINGEKQPAGKHELNIPFSNQLAAGTYFVRIISGTGQVGIKMVKE